MIVILKAFGVFENRYNAPIKTLGQPLYFVHKNSDFLISQMREVPDVDIIPESIFKKAVFEWSGKEKDGIPVYDFKRLE